MIVSSEGGDIVSGAAPVADGTYRIEAGVYPAYSGIAGQGDQIHVVRGFFRCVLPPLPLGELRLLFVDAAGARTAWSEPLIVLPKPLRLKTYALRRHYPTDYRTGARSIALED